MTLKGVTFEAPNVEISRMTKGKSFKPVSVNHRYRPVSTTCTDIRRVESYDQRQKV